MLCAAALPAPSIGPRWRGGATLGRIVGIRGMTGMMSRPAVSGRGDALGAADSGMYLGGGEHGGPRSLCWY